MTFPRDKYERNSLEHNRFACDANRLTNLKTRPNDVTGGLNKINVERIARYEGRKVDITTLESSLKLQKLVIPFHIDWMLIRLIVALQ